MYIANFRNDYDNITLDIYTDILNDYNKITHKNYTNILNNYDNLTLSNCTNNENNIDIIVASFSLTISCGLSFLWMLTLMIYTLIKPLFNK